MSGPQIDLEQPVFWTIEGQQFVFRVSELMALHIKTELLNAIVEFIQFTDVCGSPCVYRREQILGMWRTTPASREMDRAISRTLVAEAAPRIPGTDD